MGNQTWCKCMVILRDFPLYTGALLFGSVWCHISWPADRSQGVFVDETACSRCYKCTEVASSTFEIHRTDQWVIGWWWLVGVALGVLQIQLVDCCLFFWGGPKISKLMRSLIESYYEFIRSFRNIVHADVLFVQYCLGDGKISVVYLSGPSKNNGSQLKNCTAQIWACSTNNHVFKVKLAARPFPIKTRVIWVYIYTRNAWGLPRGSINYQGINYHQLSVSTIIILGLRF